MPIPIRFNVRVYGLLIHEGKVLLSDEVAMGRFHTKFPGGGLEFGESTIECIIREYQEELGIEVEIVQHFYTTDHFLVSAFNNEEQLLSIYYQVTTAHPELIKAALQKATPEQVMHQESRRWMEIKFLTEDDLTFPMDKVVAGMLRAEYL